MGTPNHPNPPFRVSEIISAVSEVTGWPVDRIIERYSRKNGRVERLNIMVGCLREMAHPQRVWTEIAMLVNQRSHHPTQMRYYHGWLAMPATERLATLRRVRNTILKRREDAAKKV